MSHEKIWFKNVDDVSDQVNAPDVQWLDVREPDEFQMVRIPGAKLIPMGQVYERLSELDPEKETIVVCLSGGRSGDITVLLREHGFNKAYNLEGGMVAWVNANLPVERD